MQQLPKYPEMARHARLFELLRQENIALATRKRIKRPMPAEPLDGQNFQHRAETSFFGAIPVL
ncbi:MAG: hypothetical protein AAFW87_01475 [Pseudomonadota bacterium]